MKKIISATLALALMLLSPTAYAVEQPTLQKIVDKLDVTSFSNSFGPRREKGKVTLKDYGFSDAKFSGKEAVISKAGEWEYKITLLDGGSGKTKICFEDKVLNGGSYHSQDAYSLAEDKSGFLKASPAKDAACPKFAK